MVNPLGHWIQIMFGTIFHIPFRVLSGCQGIGFRNSLRILSGFQVTPVLIVLEHPLPVPVYRYFEFSMSFFVAFLNVLVSLFYGARLDGVL